MALQVATEGSALGELVCNLWASVVEAAEVQHRWVQALAADDLEFVGWNEDSPGGPYAIWRVKSTGEGIAT